MKKRQRRKPSNPSPTRRRTIPPEAVVLQYKVVELSTVDEATLENTVNSWVPLGWTVESVHFAMRESSKRPAMAFVFFTRAGVEVPADVEAARVRLQRLAEDGPAPVPVPGESAAWERLAQLASAQEPDG
jgi:hypothetical protein